MRNSAECRKPDLKELRQIEADAVTGACDREINQRQDPDAAVERGLPQGQAVTLLPVRLFAVDLFAQPMAFLLIQPMCLFGAVGEVKHGDHSQDDSGNSFEQEQPLPAPQAAEHDPSTEGFPPRAAPPQSR